MGTIFTNADSLRTHYGTRVADEDAGFAETGAVGSFKEVAFTLLGSDFVSGTYAGNANLTLPIGAAIHGNAQVEVVEAFVLGGTTPVINIGVTSSEGTNRFCQLSEAQAEAVASYSIASAGTLAANTPLTAAATINAALGGTSPTVTAAGRLVLRITYRDVGAV
jgi:hypothetical protein